MACAVDLQLLWAGYLAAFCNLVSMFYRRTSDALLAPFPSDDVFIPMPTLALFPGRSVRVAVFSSTATSTSTRSATQGQKIHTGGWWTL